MKVFKPQMSEGVRPFCLYQDAKRPGSLYISPTFLIRIEQISINGSMRELFPMENGPLVLLKTEHWEILGRHYKRCVYPNITLWAIPITALNMQEFVAAIVDGYTADLKNKLQAFMNVKPPQSAIPQQPQPPPQPPQPHPQPYYSQTNLSSLFNMAWLYSANRKR
jgi:hypothetical protein